MAHFGRRTLSGMEQENLLHKETSTSGSESYVVESIVKSELKHRQRHQLSIELSDTSDSPVLQIEFASTSRYGRKRPRVIQDNYVSWQNIEM